MVSQKQAKKEISLCAVSIKLDALALDAHPVDQKIGNKTDKRTIKLGYIREGGVIKAPVHLWMYGWLKELFRGKSKGTVVHLPDQLEAFSLGTAKELLVGKSPEEWEVSGDKTVPYELAPELKPLDLYPYHEYVPIKGGSIIKYHYKVNGKTKTVPLLIYTLLPTEMVINNLKNLGKIYGLGPKANGYRLGTFSVQESKISKIGEVLV